MYQFRLSGLSVLNCTSINGDKLEALMRKLLLGGHIVVEVPDEDGEPEAVNPARQPSLYLYQPPFHTAHRVSMLHPVCSTFSAQPEAVKLDMDTANELFCGNIQDMFVLWD